ncbi:MAG: DUF485 domain-containing protein [Alphaproteobacteria bacterium]|nr:DUF485 domain-containing protein [Alphaproteobacteria bacterium]MBV8548924.1 DUF485 domain-containing protein [Alphaproteobacteria bacterium]
MTTPVAQLPEFKELIQKRRAIALPLTIIMLLAYFGFILTIAFAPDVLSQKVGSGVTSLGIAIGFGLILLTFIVTGVFVHQSNQKLEGLIDTIHKKIGE